MTDSDLIDAIAECADALADLCEAKGLKHPKHAQHVAPARAKIKAVMAHYFERQRKAVLAVIRPRIDAELIQYPPKVKEAEFMLHRPDRRVDLFVPVGNVLIEASQMGKTFARSLMPTSLHPLTFAATAGEVGDYNSAITDLIGAAAEGLSASAAVGEDIAGEYLASNSLSKLTGDIASTSIERLQNALADAWDKGGSFDQMVDAIESTFEEFSGSRAQTIAQTEANQAYNAGRSRTAEDLGATQKSWEVESDNPCEECLANEEAGWLDMDDSFPSGDDIPLHPNCACTLNFKFEKSDEEE